MTEEECNIVTNIVRRIDELEKVKYYLKHSAPELSYIHFLLLEMEWVTEPDPTMHYIETLLKKHDAMIRREIDEEIQELKDEIMAL